MKELINNLKWMCEDGGWKDGLAVLFGVIDIALLWIIIYLIF